MTEAQSLLDSERLGKEAGVERVDISGVIGASMDLVRQDGVDHCDRDQRAATGWKSCPR